MQVQVRSASAGIAVDQEPAKARARVGAIRWDAWAGKDISRIVAATLTPPQHHFRLPWYATVDSEKNVHLDGSDPAIMDLEIHYAANAGLDFWAFCEYAEDCELSIPLRHYLSSPHRERMQFCMILHSCMTVPEAAWPGERNRLVKLLKEPTHVRVKGNRPLVFFYSMTAPDDVIATRIADFRAAARDEWAGKPYIAYMGWEPTHDWKRARSLGFDCVSAYGFGYMTHTKGLAAPFADHVAKTEQEQWSVFAKESIPSIPLIHTGWDKRPRMETPVPWEKDQRFRRDPRYIETAAPDEIAQHTARCLKWVEEHRDLDEANVAICYAWNESDEGGWLMPTRGSNGKPDTRRLDALRRVLRS